MDTLHPQSTGDVIDILTEATAHGTRLLPVGGRRHIDKGNLAIVDAELWATQLDGIVAYDPAEMIAIVEAGVRIGTLRSVLAEGGQEWPVDAPEDATVGGVIAAGIATLRALRTGVMRDSVVQMRVVTGDGRLVKSGAPTVKNVTGYDVHRLLTGSLGTLACIVEVGLKVRPLARVRRTIEAAGGIALGRELLRAVPHAAALVVGPSTTSVVLEGWPDEVDEQIQAARSVSDITEIRSDTAGLPSGAALFPDAPIVVEVSVPPSKLADVATAAEEWRLLEGVGTAWMACGGGADLDAVRARVAELGGIAPVIRGPGGLGGASVPALGVHRRLKASFDPGGVLAPGRGWGGI